MEVIKTICVGAALVLFNVKVKVSLCFY